MIAMKFQLPGPAILNGSKSISRLSDSELRTEIGQLRHLLANAVVANRDPVLRWEAQFDQFCAQNLNCTLERGEAALGAHPGWFSVIRKSLCDLLALRVELCDAELVTRQRERARI